MSQHYKPATAKPPNAQASKPPNRHHLLCGYACPSIVTAYIPEPPNPQTPKPPSLQASKPPSFQPKPLNPQTPKPLLGILYFGDTGTSIMKALLGIRVKPMCDV